MPDPSPLRLAVLRVLVVSLLLTLGARLYYLQVLDGDRLVQTANRQQTREVILPAPRGAIVDDRGRPLVTNRSSLVVSVNRSELLAEQDEEGRCSPGCPGWSRCRRRAGPPDHPCEAAVPRPCWERLRVPARSGADRTPPRTWCSRSPRGGRTFPGGRPRRGRCGSTRTGAWPRTRSATSAGHPEIRRREDPGPHRPAPERAGRPAGWRRPTTGSCAGPTASATHRRQSRHRPRVSGRRAAARRHAGHQHRPGRAADRGPALITEIAKRRTQRDENTGRTYAAPSRAAW